MNKYDTSKYESPIPSKERRTLLRAILYLPIVFLAVWGSREINDYERKMEELVELKTSYIDELKNPKLEEREKERILDRISFLETSEHHDKSPSKGKWMILGSFLLAAIFAEVERKTKRENQSGVTTPDAARPTS